MRRVLSFVIELSQKGFDCACACVRVGSTMAAFDIKIFWKDLSMLSLWDIRVSNETFKRYFNVPVSGGRGSR